MESQSVENTDHFPSLVSNARDYFIRKSGLWFGSLRVMRRSGVLEKDDAGLQEKNC